MGAAIKRYNDLSPKQRLFVDYYIQTDNAIDSYFNAGYMDGCDRKLQKNRQQALRAAREILKKPLVHDYIVANRPISIPETGEIDMRAITERMFLICTGQVQREIVVKGEVQYEPPSFRDQIEAAKLLNLINEKREKKTDKRASKALTAKVAALIGAARSDGQETED